VNDPLKVLVVDDEVPLTRVAASYLEREGFEVLIAHTGPDAVQMARDDKPDLLLLDVVLPGFDGIEVCRQVCQFSDVYVIILTARDQEIDKVLGLSIGAYDYLVKPFSPREMIARIRAMLRRPRGAYGAPSGRPLTIGGLSVDVESRTASVDGVEVQLTRTEFDLLVAMVNRPRAALTRRHLISEVWGDEWYGDDHVVDVDVAHLRSKLGDDASEPRLVRTVRGVGYGMGSG
jgi:DNA-binding response OmpR family regulator